jgi:hypothetical protein
MWRVRERQLRQVYRQRLWRALVLRRDPIVVRIYAMKCAMHYHVHRLVGALRHQGGMLNTF